MLRTGSFRFRHYRQPGEKPDARKSFGASELSPVLEDCAAKAGIDYSRLSLGRQTESFRLALASLRTVLGLDPSYSEFWHPAGEAYC